VAHSWTPGEVDHQEKGGGMNKYARTTCERLGQNSPAVQNQFEKGIEGVKKTVRLNLTLK